MIAAEPKDVTKESPVPSEGKPASATATASATAPSVRFESIRASYGRIEVLHGIDLTVPSGSVFALLGPNGAGKSTLLKVTNGRMPASAGTVAIDGVATDRFVPEALAQAGVCAIPEGRGIFPNLTVRENLRMWTYQGRITRAEAEELAYARFPRLGERRRQIAGTLSGGEQQMLAISRALVGTPRLLLLDEISMGLAPLVVADLYELVGHIAEEGVTVILVEQFVTTALAVATHAAILLHGRVHRVGSPTEMADAARGAYLSGES